MHPPASQLVLERRFDPPLDRGAFIEMARSANWCFEMHRVDWHGSLLSSDGRSLVCTFSAADRESVRQALRKADADMSRLWSGSLHRVPGEREPNVLVERTFGEAVALDDIQALEDASRWCLDVRGVRFVCTYFSEDRRRMLCLYRAPDAEAVRDAQREAGMPVDRVWTFDRLGPEHVA